MFPNSSSESDMEEEDEEDPEELDVEQPPPSPSDLGGVPWKEAVELHAKLRGEEGGDEAQDTFSRDGELDEEEEDEDEEEEESSEGSSVFPHFV